MRMKVTINSDFTRPMNTTSSTPLFCALALLAIMPLAEANQITVPVDQPSASGARYRTRFQMPIAQQMPAPAPKTYVTYSEPPVYDPSPLSLDVTFSYNVASKELLKVSDWGQHTPKVDTLGVDLTLSYALDKNNSFNLRFGYAGGSDDCSDTDGLASWKQDFRAHNFQLMPGYRFTKPISAASSFFFGVNMGVINRSVKVTDSYTYVGATTCSRYHASSYGFAYSAEIGMIFNVTECTHLTVAYQFSGSTAKPVIDDQPGYRCKSNAQLFHSVRVGVGIHF